MKQWSGSVLTALLCVMLSATAHADDTCTLKELAKLDMTPVADGRFSVPMSIGGQNVAMLVDTGGYLSMLTPPTVTALQLRPRDIDTFRVDIEQYGGLRIRQFVQAHDIALGHMLADRFVFLVMPEGGYETDIGGLLAPDIMRGYDMEFDFANASLNFFSRDHCVGQVVYWTAGDYGEVDVAISKDGHMSVPLTIDGKEIRAIIDTGAADTVASLDEVEDVFGIDEKNPDLKVVPGSRPDSPVYTYPFKSLSFESVAVSNPKIVLIPDKVSHPGFEEPKMLLGMNILRHLHMYIAYHEHKLYVTPATAH